MGRIFTTALIAAAFITGGCAATHPGNAASPDAPFVNLVGRECLVVLRADAVGGQNVTDTAPTDPNDADSDNSDNANTPVAEVLPGVLYGTLTSLSPHWVVLQGRGGNQFFIPRESVAVVSVIKK